MSYTRTARNMIWRQWAICFLFCAIFFGYAAMTEHRLQQIDTNYQEEIHNMEVKYHER